MHSFGGGANYKHAFGVRPLAFGPLDLHVCHTIPRDWVPDVLCAHMHSFGGGANCMHAFGVRPFGLWSFGPRLVSQHFSGLGTRFLMRTYALLWRRRQVSKLGTKLSHLIRVDNSINAIYGTRTDRENTHTHTI